MERRCDFCFSKARKWKKVEKGMLRETWTTSGWPSQMTVFEPQPPKKKFVECRYIHLAKGTPEYSFLRNIRSGRKIVKIQETRINIMSERQTCKWISNRAWYWIFKKLSFNLKKQVFKEFMRKLSFTVAVPKCFACYFARDTRCPDVYVIAEFFRHGQ